MPHEGGRSHPLPIIITELKRSRDGVRVSLDRFKNRDTIDIRSWWRDGDGTLKSSRTGLMLAVEHLPALADALTGALQRARILELIEPTTKSKDRTAAERQRRPATVTLAVA